MESIGNYEIIEKLVETRDSVIYKGRRKGGSDFVVIKDLKTQSFSKSEIARHKQEYKTILDLNIKGIVNIQEIFSHEDRIIYILDDFKADYINKYMEENGIFNTGLFLETGIQITETIGEYQKKNIIHHNINPQSILINPDNGQIKITNFGLSSELVYDKKKFSSGDLQEHLKYISPEQTGRMNRIIDYRTDFYSLGATFYLMVTGKMPFDYEDPLELIYSHIAREPVPPIELNHNIPEVISNIILKLMSKNPDDRYQSAFGIVSDLNECLKRIKQGNKIETFELAGHDIPNRFIIPQKLFGREKETDLLMSAFERVSRVRLSDEDECRPEIMLIMGGSGIGKSALINEIYKPVTERRGYFISGKYEQFRSDTPYSSVIQAFQKLLRQILTESNEKIEFIKANLLDTLGPNGRIIIDIIPELELIIGKQPEVTKLGPNETRDRYNIVFERFVSVFTKEEHPVVLFLDDLQWADPASLLLVRNLLTNYQICHLLIIGSYRGNEVSETHPLTGILNEIEKANIRINSIILSDLKVDDVKNLIVNFLRCSEQDGYSLAESVCKKTGGNPFFVHEFLYKLYNEKLIGIDSKTGWKWNIEKINNLSITNNVVELLSNKIKNLPDRIQDVLKTGACIGNRFDLETLSYLLEKSIDETLSVLTETIDEGFINIACGIYLFNHDRIQEIVYSFLNEDEKSQIHYKLGRLILDKTDPDDLQNILFYVVDQLNLGHSLIKDNQEKIELAQLNLRSGIKAKEAAAFTPGLRYFETALRLLGKDCWLDQYDLTLAIYTEAAEAAYLNGDYDLMNNYASIVINSSKDIYDAIQVYFTKIHTCDTQSNFSGSIRIAFNVFKELNFNIPQKPGKIRIFLLLLKIRLFLKIRGVNYLYNLPEMTDPKMLAVAKILTFVSKSSYFVFPDFFTYAVSKQIDLSIKYGQCGSLIIAYVEMAGVFNSVIGNIDTGYKLGNLALDLCKKLNAGNYKIRAAALYYAMIMHWKEHLKLIIPEFKKIRYQAIETGDIERIADSIYMYDQVGFLLGTELTEFEQETAKNHKLIEQLRQTPFLAYHSVIRQTTLNLLGRDGNPAELSGSALDKDKMIPFWEESNAGSMLRLFYTNSIMLKYLFGDYKRALADSNAMIKYQNSFLGHVTERDYAFYSSLAKLAVYTDQSKSGKREYNKFIRQSLKEYYKWVKHAPMNNIHRIYIIKAELARVLGRDKKAEVLFDKAVELCRKNEYLIEEALANEIACRYYISKDRKKLAQIYLQDAFACYSRWGACAKLRQLENKYPELLLKIDDSANEISASGSDSGIVDLKTVVKATQAISGEVALGKLLEKMINITMENAGARRGFIILENKGDFFVEAEAEIEREEVKVLNSIPVTSYKDLSASMVYYVARTYGPLILDDASGKGDFINDPYVQRCKPKSILCAPILYKGKLVGVLYFENNISTGVFNRERLEVLNILSSQMAISIENAKFYENLEDKVRERTEDLEREISERKRIEEQLKVSNKELESFAYMVSHDLQEPLRKIMRFGDRLKTDENSTNEKNTDYLDRMQNAAKRMQDLINGLLNYSRVTTKSEPFRQVDLNQIVSDVISDLEIRIRDTGGNIIAEKLPVINADALQMRQLFQNIIGNALKFHIQGKPPIINISQSDDVSNNYYTIHIVDNGIGIDKKDIDRIFGVFQKLHGRSEYEGSGIGLAICKKIVERHNGNINVDSTPGIGTKFIINFPIMK